VNFDWDRERVIGTGDLEAATQVYVGTQDAVLARDWVGDTVRVTLGVLDPDWLAPPDQVEVADDVAVKDEVLVLEPDAVVEVD